MIAPCLLIGQGTDSTFESALIGGIRPTVGLNFSTHLPTAVGRLSLRRLVGRCVLKIGRCVLSIRAATVWPLFSKML